MVFRSIYSHPDSIAHHLLIRHVENAFVFVSPQKTATFQCITKLIHFKMAFLNTEAWYVMNKQRKLSWIYNWDKWPQIWGTGCHRNTECISSTRLPGAPQSDTKLIRGASICRPTEMSQASALKRRDSNSCSYIRALHSDVALESRMIRLICTQWLYFQIQWHRVGK